MTPNVWIVLVDFNGIEDTRKCLRSLVGQTAPARVVVVDNASRTNVADVLAVEFPWAEFVRSDVNGGWAGGNNFGMKHALARGADWMILLNNDTVVGPDFTARMTAAGAAHPAFGMIGPVIRFLAPPHEVQTDGVKFNRPQKPGFFQRHPVPLQTTTVPGIVEIDIVNGCCLMVRSDVVRTIGLIDEEFFLIHEESDFCLRCQAAGYKNGVLTEALVWHKGSSSFLREGKRLQRYFDARNLLRLIGKHGSRPGSRGLLRSYGHHLRYAFHRFAVEREKKFDDSAAAVIEGLYDGLIGRWGMYAKQARRPGLRLATWFFDQLLHVSSGKKPVPEPTTEIASSSERTAVGPAPPISA